MGSITHGGRKNSGIDALEYAKQMEGNGAGELLQHLWTEMEHRLDMILI